MTAAFQTVDGIVVPAVTAAQLREVDRVAVEALALVGIGQDREVAPLFQSGHAAVAVLADREPSLAIERESVGARLMIFAYIGSRIAAFGTVDIHNALRAPPEDRVKVGRTEQKVSLFCPNGSFRKRKIRRHFFQLGIPWNQEINVALKPNHLEWDLARDSRPCRPIEVESC